MAPRVQIPVHVFGFGVAMMPPILYGLYYLRNRPSEEEFEEVLKEHYGSKIQQSKARRDDMVKVFQGIKDPGSNDEIDRKMAEVLRGGRGEAKRHYAVDSKLYGTEEGVIERQRSEEERKKREERRKKKLREKKLREKKDLRSDKGTVKEKDDLARSTAGAVEAGEREEETAMKQAPESSRGDGEKSLSQQGSDGSIDTKFVMTVTSVGVLAAAVGFFVGGKRSR